MENRTVLTSAIVGVLVYVYSNAHAWDLPWENSATKEAQTAAEGAVYDRITKCEESYFLKVDDNNYMEIKGISMSITPEEVTDVDKANGVEWKGGMVVAAKMYRTLQTFSDGKVSNGEWRDGSTGIPGFSGLTTFHDPSGEARKLGFRKVNGQWSFNKKDTFGFFSGLPDKKAFSCSAVLANPQSTSPTAQADSAQKGVTLAPIPLRPPTQGTPSVPIAPPSGWKSVGTFDCPVGWNTDEGWCEIGSFGPGTIRIRH